MLILVIFCQDIFVNFINVLERSVLERSRTISQKMFSLVPGDVLCDRDEVFEVFVDIDSAGRSIIVKCLFLAISYCVLS